MKIFDLQKGKSYKVRTRSHDILFTVLYIASNGSAAYRIESQNIVKYNNRATKVMINTEGSIYADASTEFTPISESVIPTICKNLAKSISKILEEDEVNNPNIF